MEGFRGYAQHFQILSFHVFQSFSLNTNVSTHVLRSSSLNTNINYPCSLELLAQHKTLSTHVLQSSSLNTKHIINHVLQGPCQTKQAYIYIINNWLMLNIYKKSSCSYVVGSWTQYIKIKYQDNIIINKLMPISVRLEIRDITSLPA